MSKPQFASKAAEKLAQENNVEFDSKWEGSGKNGTITVSDVRGYLDAVSSLNEKSETQETEQPEPKTTRKQPRYKVEKNPQGHIERFDVHDTSLPEGHYNRIVKNCDTEPEANEYVKRLNR
jgi:pyruvate/2-oxoglutarate dehydrogenase complex dihydrolipoamide acyltransferase (E2) component